MEQQLCLNCSKPLIKVEGRKAKKYCDDKCRASHWNKHNKKKAPQWVRKEVHEELQEKYEILKKDYDIIFEAFGLGRDIHTPMPQNNLRTHGVMELPTKEKKVPVIEDKVVKNGIEDKPVNKDGTALKRLQDLRGKKK